MLDSSDLNILYKQMLEPQGLVFHPSVLPHKDNLQLFFVELDLQCIEMYLNGLEKWNWARSKIIMITLESGINVPLGPTLINFLTFF